MAHIVDRQTTCIVRLENCLSFSPQAIYISTKSHVSSTKNRTAALDFVIWDFERISPKTTRETRADIDTEFEKIWKCWWWQMRIHWFCQMTDILKLTDRKKKTLEHFSNYRSDFTTNDSILLAEGQFLLNLPILDKSLLSQFWKMFGGGFLHHPLTKFSENMTEWNQVEQDLQNLWPSLTKIDQKMYNMTPPCLIKTTCTKDN